MHILEWPDVKLPNSTSVESIGCWSTRKAQFNKEPAPVLSAEMDHLGLWANRRKAVPYSLFRARRYLIHVVTRLDQKVHLPKLLLQ